MPFQERSQSDLPESPVPRAPEAKHDYSGPADLLIDAPDPTGPPVPVKRRPFQFTLRSLVLGTVACGSVVAVLWRSNTSSCMGATRSARLEWEERQSQIEQAEQSHRSEVDEGNVAVETVDEQSRLTIE